MATQTQGTAAPAPRRLLLVDFDWKDADLIPELFREPGVSVRLVAGDGPQDPGVRVAELCGLPRTLDLVIARAEGVLINSSSAPSRTGRPWSPCNGWCPS